MPVKEKQRRSLEEKLPLWFRKILPLIKYLYIFGSFILLDLWLRYVTRSIGYYSIKELAPNLFTVAWSLIISVIVTLMPNKLSGRIVYGIFYYIAMIYVVVQDGYYQLMGNFLYLSDFLFASEGLTFISYAERILTLNFALHVLMLIAIGVIGILLFPDRTKGFVHYIVKGAAVIAAVVTIALTPKLYGEYNPERWNAYSLVPFEYDTFSNSTFDLQLTGAYQFVARNVQLELKRAGILEGDSETIEEIDEFFLEKAVHEDNEMTGIFEGKNVIFVMMESLDDWLITEEDTPTLWMMEQNGINFTRMYTPEYATGYTFNTEFAFNTGVYPYTSSNAAYGLAHNDFSRSLASLFTEAGYSANSYHRSDASYYNRGSMHVAFGYSAYHCFDDYPDADVDRDNDTYFARCDDLYHDITGDDKFMAFLITISPHAPYTSGKLTKEAAIEHEEYSGDELDELTALKAKVRLTDDMFAELIERLREDGILDDTVIVAFSDHYCYGYSDFDYLNAMQEELTGDTVLERTAFMIYSTSLSEGMEVDKYMQTTDMLPTMANLFGLEVPRNVMGNDVFDPNYEGYVFFANMTWLTKDAYIKDGEVVWNYGMTDDEIAEMSDYVRRYHVINDEILDSNYYRHTTIS